MGGLTSHPDKPVVVDGLEFVGSEIALRVGTKDGPETLPCIQTLKSVIVRTIAGCSLRIGSPRSQRSASVTPSSLKEATVPHSRHSNKS
jgi:hypothetical protein